ncbi:DNA-binding protein modulo [Anastrepha ludens]|uniref:DNA-binding protein modulo n=1 Tax=Anastrepha ludens TaxID=28586 RepID=UPI0023AFCA5A|nr:DNA-binding protein modulo [Anastrepha ludens]
MKQKKGNVSIKSPFNGVKKAGISPAKETPGKINQKKTGISPARGTPVKINQKKGGKTPVKAVPPKKVEEEEEDDSDEEEDSGADVAAGIADDAEDSAAEDQGDENEVDDEDDDDDEDDEDDDDEDGDEDDDDEDEEAEDGDLLDNEAEEEGEDESDDEEPAEAPIEKKSAELPVKATKAKKEKSSSESAFSKIKTGALPKDFPKDQVLVVKNLPKQYKQIDLVEVFAKYGNLHTIHNIHGPVSSVAYVAYSSPEEAEAAQAGTDNIAKVKDVTLKVNIQTPNPKKLKRVENKQMSAEEKKAAYEDKKRKIEESKSRTVYVKNIKQGTTEEQLKEHFAECGEIESVSLFPRNPRTYAFVCFKDASSIPAAVNLHNSVLNGLNLWVQKGDEQNKEVTKDPQRTIFLKNSQNLACIEPDKLDSIFSKCGEIEGYSILCKKNVLAFITFANQKGAKKALQLNGTSANGLDIEIEEFKVITPRNKSTVFIQNVKPGTTEDDIRELFASTGPIEHVHLSANFATVKFEDVESFCKAFLLNESYLRGQLIFIEPYSEKKQAVLRSVHQKSSFNRKRPAPFKKGGYAKKPRPN